MTTVAGVDGCRLGWIALIWSPRGLDAATAAAWGDLPLERAAVAAVDMPIGLAETGPRACDVAARRLLPRARKASVFAPPRRYMLGLNWAAANSLGKAREGKGLTRQAGGIAPRIAELDAALAPDDQARIRETHPELVFHRLSGGQTLPAKATAAGRDARLDLIRRAGMPDPMPLLARLPRRGLRSDDILDAAACVFAAADMVGGRARRLPPGAPPRDTRGLSMEIWY